MSTRQNQQAPEWAPRLPQADIQKLYKQAAAGPVDEELLNTVGTGLLTRCESILIADDAVRGRAKCPACDQVTEHDAKSQTQLLCGGCAWTGTWWAYRKTLKGENLNVGGLRAEIEEFANGFPRCRKARTGFIRIDTLLHLFHRKKENCLGKVFAFSLIEGDEDEVIQLLEELSYGSRSAHEVIVTRDLFISRLQERAAMEEEAARKTRELRIEKRSRLREERDAVETFGPPAPEYASRIPPRLIAQLYEVDAKGIQDEELLDEVAYGILTRVESIMVVTRAMEGQVQCPMCPIVIERRCIPEEVITCKCGWIGTWENYRRSYKGERISAGGMRPYYEDFRRSFPAVRGYQKKMILVDQLIHRFHDYMKSQRLDVPTRSNIGAANLIEGKVRDVIAFLDSLTYSDRSTPGMSAVRQTWHKRLMRP